MNDVIIKNESIETIKKELKYIIIISQYGKFLKLNNIY